jgi:hypothetical protein
MLRATFLKLTGLAALLVGCGAAAHASMQSGQSGPDREWRFSVSVDGRPIGEQSFVLTEDAGRSQVTIRARFQVRVLFVPVYRYEHDNREEWQDGCLVRIDALTRDNGENLFVHGEQRGETFVVEGPNGRQRLPPCVNTFAYWDRAFLAADRLLNSQTGEYTPVNVVGTPRQEMLKVGDRELASERYTLEGPDFSIELWYSPEGEWLALESTTNEGRKLRYERQ